MLQIAADCMVLPNQIYAVGDSDNDLSMLQNAAIAFVPENAVLDILQHAFVRVRDNNHDAVAHVIEYLDQNQDT